MAMSTARWEIIGTGIAASTAIKALKGITTRLPPPSILKMRVWAVSGFLPMPGRPVACPHRRQCGMWNVPRSASELLQNTSKQI